MMRSIGQKIWLLQYAIEAKRQHYASGRKLFRQALFCILLALLGGGQ